MNLSACRGVCPDNPARLTAKSWRQLLAVALGYQQSVQLRTGINLCSKTIGGWCMIQSYKTEDAKESGSVVSDVAGW